MMSLTACGRFSFEVAPDAAPDASVRCDPTAPFTSTRRLDTLSSTDGDGGLRMSTDELVVVMHSDRPPSVGGYGLYTTTRATRDDEFSAPTNTGIGGFFPALSTDQLTLAYDAGGEIYATTRINTSVAFMGASAPLATVSTAATEFHPYFGASGTSFYFVRDLDLYAATWPPPVQVRPLTELNTALQEQHPVISADELTIYFTVTDGIDDTDIWMASRATTADAFSNVTLVDASSVDHDSPTWLSPDNCRLYFESTRGAPEYNLFIAGRSP